MGSSYGPGSPGWNGPNKDGSPLVCACGVFDVCGGQSRYDELTGTCSGYGDADLDGEEDGFG